MALLDKVAFWKKKDDFGDPMGDGKDPFGAADFGSDPGPGSDPGFGSDPMGGAPAASPTDNFSGGQPDFNAPPQSFQPSPPQTSMGQPAQPAYQPAAPTDNTEYINQKNLEVISSKIDALKAALDSINQRLAHLEQLAQADSPPEQRRGGFY